MRRRIYCLLSILWAVTNCYTQSPPVNIRPLTIGDTIPADLEITNVYNYPVSKIRLADLRGKLVILDFWATWCAACIKGFPKAEELQKQFKDKIQIIMVNTDTSDNAAKVSNFLAKQKQRTGQSLTLPYAVQNTSFLEYFPHREIPHYIWINEGGKVKGVTSADDLSAENITAMLEQHSKILHTKKDDLRFNHDKPLLIDENGGDNPTDFIYRSIFTGFKENLGTGIGSKWGAEQKSIRYYILNADLLLFLQIAYRDIFKDYGQQRIVVESTKYSKEKLFTATSKRKTENRFCYEITLPTVSDEEININLRQDLTRTFGISVRNDMRILNCYVIEATKKVTYLRTKGGKRSIDISPSALNKHLSNHPVKSLVDILQPRLDAPVVNETGIDYNIDMSLPYNFHNYSSSEIIEFLEENGFRLLPSKKTLEVVVIEDK